MWLANSDERRGYNRARNDLAGAIANMEAASFMQARQARTVAQQLQAQILAANAVNQDLQSRLQASEECVRFLDQSNADLCAELLELSAKLDDWKAYGQKSQAIMAQQNAQIVKLKAALEKARFNIKSLMVDSQF